MGLNRLVLLVLLTVLVVGFAFGNTHHVGVSFVFGGPVRVRLIFLLATTFGLGALTPAIVRTIRGMRRLRQHREAMRRAAAREDAEQARD